MQLLKKKCCLRNFLKLFPFSSEKKKGEKKKKKGVNFAFTQQQSILIHHTKEKEFFPVLFNADTSSQAAQVP